MISIDEFRKIEIRVGRIIECEKVEGADKLLKLQVDFGEFQRQIASGIAEWYTPEELIGKKLPFVVNLEPRTFRGVESQGMLMAAEGKERPVLLEPSEDLPEGAIVV